MVSFKDAPPGYASVIHQGPLHPPTLLKAPHRFVCFNIMVAIMICLWVSMLWLIFMAAGHISAALCWAYDPHLLVIVWRHLWYAPIYRA